VLALEAARLLEQRGLRISLIAMIDSRVPKAHPLEQSAARGFCHSLFHHANQWFELAPERRWPYLAERVAWQK
jgi:thioesterase domain-containing protein